MNRYHDYMDRIQAPEELRERILAGKRPRRSRPALAAGALAACCLVAAVGGWQLWQGRAETQPDPTAGAAATPAVDRQSAYTLVVADPFEGRPHSFPNIPGYDYPDCTGSDAVAADYALPEGWFREELTAREIIAVLGGADAVPWTLDWTGFGLDGTVIYDGEGHSWRIDIVGRRGEDTLRLELWPGREPLIDLIYADAGTETVDGVEVTTYSLYYDRDGDGTREYTCHADHYDGTMGVNFTCTSRDQSTAARLTSLVAGHREFTADGLAAAAVPEWRSETLDQTRAYEEELARYLPDPAALPDGFVFEGAYRELGQDRDRLSVLWCRGYDEIGVWAERLLTPRTEETLAGELLPHEVNARTLEGLGRYVDDDQGDTPGWRYDAFTVCYTEADGDAVAVTWSIRGLEPEQAAALVNSCQAMGESRVHPIQGHRMTGG